MRVIRKNVIHLELNPFIINNLPIITGDFSYTLRKIDIKNFLFFNATLLSFYHGNKIIHTIRDNILDILTFIDTYEKSSIVRIDNLNLKFEFDKFKNLNLIESGYKFNSIDQLPKEKIKYLNIGIIKFKIFNINDEGLQGVYAAAWKSNEDIFYYYLGEKDIYTS